VDRSSAPRYTDGLERRAANHRPLSPLGLFARAVTVYADKTAVIAGERRFTYRELGQRCRRLASALTARGVGPGDTVSVLASNTLALLEAHFGVPLTGAVLNAINYRLDAVQTRHILEHARTRILLTDREYADTAGEALVGMQRPPLVIDIDDPAGGDGVALGVLDYETLLAEGSADFSPPELQDEWQAIALNYTSGTTGQPKGAVYHHRGAYLASLSSALTMRLNEQAVCLWTLPLYHSNGWTCPWAVSAVGGSHVLLRKFDPAQVFALIEMHGVTHLCGAPVLLERLLEVPTAPLARPVEVVIGGAAPSAQLIAALQTRGFRVTQVYGLVETFGPAAMCVDRPDWATLPAAERSALLARQGVACLGLDEIRVADPATMTPVPPDGQTMGEVLVRGNAVMKGYLDDPAATADAFRGGWFHTGDLGVCRPDGTLEIKDRIKDVILCGGESIASREVEAALDRHPAIIESAAVARPDPHWGETVCAFVTLKADAEALTAEDIIAWSRAHLAAFQVPRTVIFGELPKTPDGEVQKFILRERARAL